MARATQQGVGPILEALSRNLPRHRREALSTMRQWVSTVLTGKVQIPPYPAVALRIQAILKNANFNYSDLQTAVQMDPTVSASVLRIANSPFYARVEPVETLRAAIVRLGTAKLSTIAMTATMQSGSAPAGPIRRLRRTAIRDSVASAVLCQALATSRGGDIDLAFTCGLLHDLGSQVAIGALESAAKKEPKLPFDLVPEEAWPLLLHPHHIELGRRIAKEWELPAQVQEVIDLHHAGDALDPGSRALLRMVATSDVITRLLGDCPHVSSAQLVEIGGLDSFAEAQMLERRLPSLAPFLATFNDTGATPRPRSQHADILFTPDLDPSLRPVGGQHELPVHVKLAGGVKVFRAVGMSSLKLAIEGPHPLEERSLFHFALMGSEQLPFWGEVLTCQPAGKGLRIELRPICLSLVAWETWGRFVASLPEAVPNDSASSSTVTWSPGASGPR